jgi:hypothetical protein
MQLASDVLRACERFIHDDASIDYEPDAAGRRSFSSRQVGLCSERVE